MFYLPPPPPHTHLSPANVPEVVTVSATNLATKHNGSRAGEVAAPEALPLWLFLPPCECLMLSAAPWFTLLCTPTHPTPPPCRRPRGVVQVVQLGPLH
jgi:hypothetical protein